MVSDSFPEVWSETMMGLSIFIGSGAGRVTGGCGDGDRRAARGAVDLAGAFFLLVFRFEAVFVIFPEVFVAEVEAGAILFFFCTDTVSLGVSGCFLFLTLAIAPSNWDVVRWICGGLDW